MKAVLIAVCSASVLLAGLGGGQTAGASPLVATALAKIRVTIIAPTHSPKVNVPWPVQVKVTDATGKPVAATLTMLILFQGAPVAKVDNGVTYHFVGTWEERKGHALIWPARSRGVPLVFQAVVEAQGVTIRRDWAIAVV